MVPKEQTTDIAAGKLWRGQLAKGGKSGDGPAGGIGTAALWGLGVLVLLPLLCSIAYCVAAGFGLFDPAGNGFTFRHYAALWNRGDLPSSFLFTSLVTLAGTLLSYAIALPLALAVRSSSLWNGISRFLIHIPLPFPHQIAAVFVVLFFAQSGLISRGLAGLGLISGQEAFPALVFDGYGIGILLAYLWKEVPFLTVAILAVLSGIGAEYEEVARSLGAGRMRRLRHVLLPAVTRGALPNIILLAAFIFGAFEVPLMVGPLYPPTVAVLTLQRMTPADITQRGEAFALGTIVALTFALLALLYAAMRRERHA